MTARGRLPKPAFVPPTNRLTLVTVYSALDITACIGLFFLIVLGARIKGLRSNFVLLNFEFVLFLTALGQTLLIWTGHALSDDPPRIMCVVSGAFLAATAVFKAAAAFSLTYKIWSHTIVVAYPTWKWSPGIPPTWPLVVLPWLAGSPLFVVTLVMGLRDITLIRRTSVYYCLVEDGAIGVTNIITAGIFEFFSLIMALWTAWIVIRKRRQLRSMAAAASRSLTTSRSPVHYSLIVRTLAFSAVLALALSIQLVVAATKSKAPIFGMSIACIDFTALLVFASDPVFLRSLSPIWSRAALGESNTNGSSTASGSGSGSGFGPAAGHHQHQYRNQHNVSLANAGVPNRFVPSGPKHIMHHDGNLEEERYVDVDVYALKSSKRMGRQFERFEVPSSTGSFVFITNVGMERKSEAYGNNENKF